MSKHVPECLMNLEYAVRVCICDELRACEQRVRSAELAEAKALLASRDEAWYAGVDAARGVVMPYLAMLTRWSCTAANWEQTDALMRRAVNEIKAAIDALREGKQ